MIDEAIKGTEADDFHELYAAAKKHHGSETEAELTLYLKNVETVADKVKNLEHEVDTLFTNLDWLRIYQKAIKDQGMDLDSVICATRDFETCPEDAEGTYYDDQIDNLNRQY
jgi:ABC-type phosphate transport system auxiliary subunit